MYSECLVFFFGDIYTLKVLLYCNLGLDIYTLKVLLIFQLIHYMYSLMLIIPLLFIVGIVVDVKLIRFNIFIMYYKYNLHSNNFLVYLFSLIKILQINAGEGNQNVDEDTEDDFEEEDDLDGSQKENTDSDDD